MAGPFYVDLANPGAWNGRDGTNLLSPWLGVSGLQKAFDSVLVTEICYVKGEGDLSKFYSVAYDADNDTTLIDGEAVTWGVDATAGVGVVHITSTTATSPGTVEIEVTSGAAPADDLVITGSTSGGTITPTAAIAMKGVDIDTQAGANATGYITFIGVTDFTPTYGARAILDFNEDANSDDCITIGGAQDMYHFENIEVMGTAGSAKHGWSVPGNSADGCVWINCAANTCSGNGFNVPYAYYHTLIRCVSYNNTGHGFYVTGSGGGKEVFCAAYGNGDSGFYGVPAAVACIAHDNTDDGFENVQCISLGCLLCVADGNGDDGFFASFSQHGPGTLLGCRGTNQSGAGDCGVYSVDPVLMGWCVFDNNTDNVNIAANMLLEIPSETDGVTSTNNSINEGGAGGGDTNQGYAEAVANHNFATNYVSAADPTTRRTAITIPWT